ncbi:hypothetical protein EIP75_21650 [Aquabacterium soli]|uniref:Uncharacterized protein n=1 Tax=Aquabacterium soli TaxID=2493092 RepID=A0A426V2P2_9BURK|nr:hypothetical protein [Aquabacterium soli]RRS01183.1 hypothetical protein EIP75_21650 [Aquabacterium soli]
MQLGNLGAFEFAVFMLGLVLMIHIVQDLSKHFNEWDKGRPGAKNEVNEDHPYKMFSFNTRSLFQMNGDVTDENTIVKLRKRLNRSANFYNILSLVLLLVVSWPIGSYVWRDSALYRANVDFDIPGIAIIFGTALVSFLSGVMPYIITSTISNSIRKDHDRLLDMPDRLAQDLVRWSKKHQEIDSYRQRVAAKRKFLAGDYEQMRDAAHRLDQPETVEIPATPQVNEVYETGPLYKMDETKGL